MVGLSTFGRMTHAPHTVSSRNRTSRRGSNTRTCLTRRSFKASVCRAQRQLWARAGTSVGQGRGLAAAATTASAPVAGNGGVIEVVNVLR
jgi:hypothetical protein